MKSEILLTVSHIFICCQSAKNMQMMSEILFTCISSSQLTIAMLYLITMHDLPSCSNTDDTLPKTAMKTRTKSKCHTVFAGVKAAVFLEEKISKSRGAAFAAKE